MSVVDESRGDGVHRDAAARELPREAFGEADEPRLARRVVRLPGIADEPDDAGDIDDARRRSASACVRWKAFTMLNAPFRFVSSTTSQSSSLMRSDSPSRVRPALFTRMSTRAEVRQHLLAQLRRPPLRAPRPPRSPWRAPGNFALISSAGFGGIRLRAAHHRHSRPRAAKAQRDGLADAAARSGDHRSLVCKIKHGAGFPTTPAAAQSPIFGRSARIQCLLRESIPSPKNAPPFIRSPVSGLPRFPRILTTHATPILLCLLLLLPPESPRRRPEPPP